MYSSAVKLLAAVFLAGTCIVVASVTSADPPARPAPGKAPYAHSKVISGMDWHWDTRRTAAPGSDLWPITWGPDGNLYASWGDGGGFGGTDSLGRVAMGFARIEGPAEQFHGFNVNGGGKPEHPASFPKSGKTGGILSVNGVLWAWLNTQDGPWPDVDQALVRSEDLGATWKRCDWIFPRGAGNFKPGTFLNFGRDYSGVPGKLRGYVYFYGARQAVAADAYLGRVPVGKLADRAAYQFFAGMRRGQPKWSDRLSDLRPVFTDAAGTGDLASISYDPALRRYLLTNYHNGPGQLGVFEGPEPWGPWRTIAYYEDWGGMGAAGEGLTCSFPQKWMSEDGRQLWCVFSVYGGSAHQGIDAHDRFNLVQVTLRR